jgi:hypothetical protein
VGAQQPQDLIAQCDVLTAGALDEDDALSRLCVERLGEDALDPSPTIGRLVLVRHGRP